MIEALIWIVIVGGVVLLFVKGGRPGRRSGIGTAAVGSVYDMLNEDKRKAVEIIVEERAEARDPETKDGNLPDLEVRQSPVFARPSNRNYQDKRDFSLVEDCLDCSLARQGRRAALPSNALAQSKSEIHPRCAICGSDAIFAQDRVVTVPLNPTIQVSCFLKPGI